MFGPPNPLPQASEAFSTSMHDAEIFWCSGDGSRGVELLPVLFH